MHNKCVYSHGIFLLWGKGNACKSEPGEPLENRAQHRPLKKQAIAVVNTLVADRWLALLFASIGIIQARGES